MYNYSPISKMYIRNFRNLGDVELDFSESPIITLVGENEAGKTSVIKSFATCGLHANPREQKDYIRDDTKMFGVAIELEDGTRVTRIKELTGINSYQVIRSDGTKWSTNKITDGLPEEVQKVMGLISEPETNEFLHIRTYEDKLLFIVTPASANYKVMYNALKVEQLTKAIKLGSNEVNSLKSNINNNEIRMQTLQNQLRDINVVDVEPLLVVKDRLQKQLAIINKLEQAKQLKQKTNKCEIQLGALALIDKFKLEPINEVLANKLYGASRLVNKKIEATNLCNIYSESNNLCELELDILNKLSGVIDKIKLLDTKVSNAGALVQLSELSEISEIRTVQLNKAMALIDKLNSYQNKQNLFETDSCNYVEDSQTNALNKLHRMNSLLASIDNKNNELEQVNTYIEQVQDYMKQCGVTVETCPKCGETIILDMDKIN